MSKFLCAIKGTSLKKVQHRLLWWLWQISAMNTSSHPGMRSSILKKWEIDNISQAVNFKRDSNRFLGKFLNVNLSHSSSILIGCEQKNADIQFNITDGTCLRKPASDSFYVCLFCSLVLVYTLRRLGESAPPLFPKDHGWWRSLEISVSVGPIAH